MITDYASLQTAIAATLHRNDLTALIPVFIADAEERIYNDIRIQAMEASYSQAIASGVVAIPAGFLEWKFLYVDGSSAHKLTRKSAEWIYTNYPTRAAEGTPVFLSLIHISEPTRRTERSRMPSSASKNFFLMIRRPPRSTLVERRRQRQMCIRDSPQGDSLPLGAARHLPPCPGYPPHPLVHRGLRGDGHLRVPL